MENKLLMIPGPIEVASNVLKKMCTPIEAHYGHGWANFYNATIDMIKDVIKTKNETFLIVGSGHAAIEAAISSVTEKDEEVLVLSNGFFGDRIAEITESYGSNAVIFGTEWGKAIKPQDLERFLQDNEGRFKKVMMVHHETSTGVKNPVKELVKVAKNHGLLTFVDGVSSIGVTEFNMDEWGVDIIATASQKGLGAPPGLSIISVSEDGWRTIESRKGNINGWYLNLLTMRKFAEKQRDWQPYGITMAVNNVKALRKALENIQEEGLEKRIKRHNEMSDYFLTELHKLGLKTVAEEGFVANNITAIYVPFGINSEELIKIFDEDYNIIIANGLGKLSGKIVRIGHMNLGANKECLDPILKAFENIIKENKIRIKEGD